VNSDTNQATFLLNKDFIFLAEDDTDDVEFFAEAVKGIQPTIELRVAHSGKKAITFLENLPDQDLPGMIVLDYNLPEINGQEILAFLSGKERYSIIPKAVWSTSSSPYYEKICLENGADAYFVKPSNLSGIISVAEQMIDLMNKHTC